VETVSAGRAGLQCLQGRGSNACRGTTNGRCLASAIGNSAFTQVVRGQLNGNFVPGQDTNVVLSHLAGDVRGYNVPIFQFNSKHCVGQRLGDDTVHFDVIFFCQGFFAWLSGLTSHYLTGLSVGNTQSFKIPAAATDSIVRWRSGTGEDIPLCTASYGNHRSNSPGTARAALVHA